MDDAAEVDDEVVNDEEEEKSQEPEDGEDLDERIDDDYRQMPELDRYEDQGMDNDDYGRMHVSERMAAERELDQHNMARDRTKARAPAAFVDDEELSGEEDARRVHARMMRGAEEVEDDDGLGDMTNVNEYGEAKEPLAQWV